MGEESRDGQRKFDRRKLLAGLGIGAAAAFAAAFIGQAPKLAENLANKLTGKKNVWRIGFEGVSYAIAPDILVDGLDDHIQVLQAVNALPSSGGKIIMYGGPYDFNATVSRAIDNVLFEGSGKSTYLANNGSDALISAGSQTGWIVKDLRTDAGGLGGTWGTAATNLRKNIWIDTTYYNDIPNLSTDLNCNDKNLTGIREAAYKEVHVNGNSGASKTIDWAADGHVQSIVWTDNCVLTFTAPSGVCHLTLIAWQDHDGANVPVWPNTVETPDGEAIEITATGHAKDILTFLYHPNGGEGGGAAVRYSLVYNTAFGVPA